MHRNSLQFIVVVVVSVCCDVSVPADESKSDGLILRTLSRYCVECHADNEDAEANVRLSGLKMEELRRDSVLLRKLVHVLDTREMPPDDAEQLSGEVRESMLGTLRPWLHAAAGNVRSRTPMRRMNRFQYNNAVVDLLQLNCIVFTLPERIMRVHNGYFDPASDKMPDVVSVGNRALGKSQLIEPRLSGVAAFPQDLRAEHGYDNRGDHLSLSPLLMDEFLKLGESITHSPDFGPKRVGIWNDFFAEPVGSTILQQEIRSRLRQFLTKAFRRPPDDEVLQRYLSFATGQIERGHSFTDAMKSVVAATVASPRFLYLYDKNSQRSEDTSEPLHRIDDYELASRLSFFLWGSLPDEELLMLASKAKLNDPEVLAGQVNRMLHDRKLKRFCDSFPSQWLQLDRIVSSVPNRQQFPSFYFSKYRMSMHMMLEPLLLFETVLIEDLPVTQLIDSDFTYRSPGLERAYGELTGVASGGGGGVGVLKFQRRPVTDRRIGGVITNAAVMTMTSGTERTQPITRGAWIAAVIFNDPPEPPPADVPPLPEKPQAGEENLTLRQRLALHRERADCRGCHEQIDPLGFALENYSPIGTWRDVYESGLAIDASGDLFREHSFTNPVEFKDAILQEKGRFCRALAGHLLSFALARELSPADDAVLDRISKTVANDGYKMKTLMREVVLSEPFRTK